MIDANCVFFFFNDTATTEIYTLSLHDALPISDCNVDRFDSTFTGPDRPPLERTAARAEPTIAAGTAQGFMRGLSELRSEEHTSELQSRQYLVCRLLLEKKNTLNDLYGRVMLQ